MRGKAAIVADEMIRFEKRQSSGVQIIASAAKRMARLVTDDEEFMAERAGSFEKTENAWIRRGEIHARAIDIALKFGEILFAPRGVKEISNVVFAARKILRNKPSLQRRNMERAVIADDGVVEVDADPH
ncbi:MAG: hypothetical protein ACLPSW_20495 [Roseiarcus sp.]